ncbi:MAG: type II toxin-antitoxin system HicB family antitoxin [Bacteroidales bacterium]|nr:type II toxin-antitoxin system HicB family antitoxin [Bacteroidales bacterium]
MERIVNINIEKLPEGMYLATSEDIQGLVAQGRTITETIEIARDIVKKLIEAQKSEGKKNKNLLPIANSFNYPLVIGL